MGTERVLQKGIAVAGGELNRLWTLRNANGVGREGGASISGPALGQGRGGEVQLRWSRVWDRQAC